MSNLESFIRSKEYINKLIVNFYNTTNLPYNDNLTSKVIKYVTRDINIPYIINECDGDMLAISSMILDGCIQTIQFAVKKNQAVDYLNYQNKILKSSGDDNGGYTSAPADTQSNNIATTDTTVAAVSNNGPVNSNIDSTDLYRYAMILNRGSLERKTHILVDTRYRNVSGIQSNRFVFNLVQNNNNSLNPGSGDLSIGGKNIKNIIKMEVPSFNIPFVNSADNFYKKITMTINELKSDSFGAYENSNFHFMFSYESLGLLLKLTPDNSGVYTFKYPINPKSLSFSFGSPFVPISFDLDRMYASDFDYLSNNGVITFAQPHNLGSGDIVYITGFSTLNDTANVAIIATINRLEGHIITVESANSISINVDFTTVISPDNTNTPFIYFGSKRIIFPLILTYLVDQSDT